MGRKGGHWKRTGLSGLCPGVCAQYGQRVETEPGSREKERDKTGGSSRRVLQTTLRRRVFILGGGSAAEGAPVGGRGHRLSHRPVSTGISITGVVTATGTSVVVAVGHLALAAARARRAQLRAKHCASLLRTLAPFTPFRGKCRCYSRFTGVNVALERMSPIPQATEKIKESEPKPDLEPRSAWSPSLDS